MKMMMVMMMMMMMMMFFWVLMPCKLVGGGENLRSHEVIECLE
jgi:hypothetical protein